MTRDIIALWLTVMSALGLGCARQGPLEAPPPPLSVASWDGGTVTAQEIRAAAARLPVGLREPFSSPQGERDLLDAVLAQKLLADEARRRGLPDRPDIKTQVSELEQRLSIQALLADEERRLGPPTDAELHSYLEKHAHELARGLRVRASRVLLIGKPTDQALRAKAEAIRARLRKKEPIASLAKLGAGPERVRDGDLGWISEAIDPQTTLILTLTPGEVAPVVDLPNGFAVLVATERTEAQVPPFEELRETLVGRVMASRQRAAFDSLLHRLRAEANVQVNPAALR